MAPAKHYNALILGSGQAGTPLATHIKSLGQTVCLVEKAHLGGTCVNVGCTPTKTMVTSGRIAYLARRAADYGISTAGEVRVDMQKVRQRKRDIVDRFRGGSERKVGTAGVDVLMGEARFVGEREVEVKVVEGGEVERVTADKVFINVGCRPSTPEISGLEGIPKERVLDSTSVQELGEVPKHLLVIGGGTIGLEFGQLFRRLGARVTIVQRAPRLLQRSDDPELAECMHDILKREGIDICLNSGVKHVSRSNDPETPITVSVTGPEHTTDLQVSHILIATGRTPNTDTLNVSAAGITTLKSSHIQVSPTLETNIQGIYALGDVKGGPQFTHVSYDDFRILRANLYPSTDQEPPAQRTTNHRAPFIPSVTYTDPQLALLGPKFSALPRHRRLVSYSMPGSWIARGLETDETRGMLKAVVDADTDQIVSFAALSTEAGEVMSVVQMAMMGGLMWFGMG